MLTITMSSHLFFATTDVLTMLEIRLTKILVIVRRKKRQRLLHIRRAQVRVFELFHLSTLSQKCRDDREKQTMSLLEMRSQNVLAHFVRTSMTNSNRILRKKIQNVVDRTQLHVEMFFQLEMKSSSYEMKLCFSFD